MIFATRAVHCSANDVTERFSHIITGRIHTIPCAGSEVILLYKFMFAGMDVGTVNRKIKREENFATVCGTMF